MLVWMLLRNPGLCWDNLAAFAIAPLICAIPFAVDVWRDPTNFTTGYIGEKVPSGSEWFSIVPSNLLHQLLALHVSGDRIFRSNPAALFEHESHPIKVIWNTEDALPAPQLAPCLGTNPPEKHTSPGGEPVFQSLDLP